MNTTKTKAIAGIVAVFLLGVVTGILSSSIFIGHKIQQFGQDQHSFQKFFMQRLTRDLRLTEVQKPAAEKIIGEAEVEMRIFFQNSLTEFGKIMERRNTTLKTILTVEQQKKLDDLQEKMQKRWRTRLLP